MSTLDDPDLYYPVGLGEHLISKNDLERIVFEDGRTFLRDFDGTLQRVRGIIHARILPPREDLYPLLTIRISTGPGENDYRSVAGLCYKCAVTFNQKPCNHRDFERSYVDSVVSEELSYAINECNYKVIEIYEAYLYTDGGSIFRQFLNLLARDKIVASGLPESMTEEEKQMYVDDLNRDMNFTGQELLTLSDFSKNDVMRTVAKLASNGYYFNYL